MQQHKGIWLPDDESHMLEHLDRGPLFEGKGTYQLAKITPVLTWFAANSRRPGLALDVGAHVGLWSRVLASAFERVIAFEPMAHLRECFEQNLADANPACEVQLVAAAVGNDTCRVTMERTSTNSGNCHVSPAGRGAFTVEQVRLDEMLADASSERVDFIKVDTEGYEEYVIRGALKLIARDYPLIMIEQKPGVAEERYSLTQHRAKEILEKLGYIEIFYRSGDHLMCHPETYNR